MTIGKRLRERRNKAGLTLGQVTEYEGISKSYLSDLERGVNAPNVWELIARLARRYHTTTDYLLGLTDDPVSTTEIIPRQEQFASETGNDNLLIVYELLEQDQQELVLSVAQALADANAKARKHVLRVLRDRFFDGIADRVGEDEAERLMAAVDVADRGGDSAPLTSWLQTYIKPNQ